MQHAVALGLICLLPRFCGVFSGLCQVDLSACNVVVGAVFGAPLAAGGAPICFSITQVRLLAARELGS
jgi:hypothetical protein